MPGKNDHRNDRRTPWVELTEFRRDVKQLSIRQLAGLAKYSPGFVGDLETGRREPTADVYARLAAALGVPGFAFLKGNHARLQDAA